MTDRVRTLTVLLAEDTRDDDARELAEAIARFRHIVGVELGPVVDHNDWTAKMEIKREIGDQIWGLIAHGDASHKRRGT